MRESLERGPCMQRRISLSLDSLTELAIRLDNLSYDHKVTAQKALQNYSWSAPDVFTEPMQLSRTRLRPNERERRRKLVLCFYCGNNDHKINDCSYNKISLRTIGSTHSLKRSMVKLIPHHMLHLGNTIITLTLTQILSPSKLWIRWKFSSPWYS